MVIENSPMAFFFFFFNCISVQKTCICCGISPLNPTYQHSNPPLLLIFTLCAFFKLPTCNPELPHDMIQTDENVAFCI